MPPTSTAATRWRWVGEEIEFRAAAVHAVELPKQRLREAGHRHDMSMDLDYLLWNRGKAERDKAIPRHRARGVFY